MPHHRKKWSVSAPQMAPAATRAMNALQMPITKRSRAVNRGSGAKGGRSKGNYVCAFTEFGEIAPDSGSRYARSSSPQNSRTALRAETGIAELQLFEMLDHVRLPEELRRSIVTVPPATATHALNHPLASTRVVQMPLGVVLFLPRHFGSQFDSIRLNKVTRSFLGADR